MKSKTDKGLTRDYGVAFCHLCFQGKQFYALKLYIYYHITVKMLSFHFRLQYWQRSHKPTVAFLGRYKKDEKEISGIIPRSPKHYYWQMSVLPTGILSTLFWPTWSMTAH